MPNTPRRLESVCVYCASSNAAPPDFIAAAEAFGALLAHEGLRLVYGGGGVGLMGATARAAHAAGGKVLGVIPHFLTSHERPLKTVETVIVNSMHERKMMMFEEADAFAILPGGIGTLEEVIELLSWRRLGLHAKPIVFLNLEGLLGPAVRRLPAHPRPETDPGGVQGDLDFGGARRGPAAGAAQHADAGLRFASGRRGPDVGLQATPAIRLAAVTVFCSRQATVIRPTPPGTGEVQPATLSADLKWTSPTTLRLPRGCGTGSRNGTRLTPISITVAPGRIQSPVTICGRPMAAHEDLGLAADAPAGRRCASGRW